MSEVITEYRNENTKDIDMIVSMNSLCISVRYCSENINIIIIYDFRVFVYPFLQFPLFFDHF